MGSMTESPRPLILVDVDGVLNAITSAKERKRLLYHEGWRQKWVDVGGLRYRLTVNPEHGPLLRALARDTGGELAWGTTWEDDANRFVGPLAGIPKLPVIPVCDTGPCPAHVSSPVSEQRDCGLCGHKALGIVPWTQGRPFVWFDDEPDAATVTAQLAGTQPHLVVPVDERTGLTADHVAAAREWLLCLTAKAA